MQKIIDYINLHNLGEVKTDKTFKDLTTLKIGGGIKMLFYPSSISNFLKFYDFYLTQEKTDIIILGNGSNIFASDDYYNGIVVSFKKVIEQIVIVGNTVKVMSGVSINKVINVLKEKGLGGLEGLFLIPATVGGMIKMNAGTIGCTISDYLESITIMTCDGKIKKYSKGEIKFSYRKSSIKNNDIILDATFILYKKDKESIIKKMQEIAKDRKKKQPLSYNNAGSTFKNALPYSSWKLIDNASLRGKRINDAMVSSLHPNFLINLCDATSNDMLELINHVKKEVYKSAQIMLECEWNFVNFGHK